ncbi:NADH:flavin oxidoreductase/NADH oxidase family protein [Yoonia sediminilitoris]|uniref:2,4-dienoyl-CoA reductase-like NADH-dependent reductase (Old Yellow Enzyme family) n=1 Tax=Yoonia sediminilitoris TaxID=1286148 RepID=A0A2T6K913_9RHOB|nr:NADH:flavin oxidoreductase/NADH oxidase family protein [Yoonia sediminilitoris]PUB11252.1 2,4-dienoyl-CoA reductase-like NADH-dependent reductase (Old Yellow Enzyme family) [Yoonia sediminilitoris]RCW91068.1 2,4-dienoyl-CoA reductase-like NADH-dependent reductase (Old Yellow Enzyme family) [Yoonia sediminilitoris]
MGDHADPSLFQPLTLPCGAVLKNRIAKSAMSDSLGDGRGNPTDPQVRLYERWANGGVAVSIIGEVQGDPHFAEKPGNLVLRHDSDMGQFRKLADAGAADGAQLWLQLGHAGAMAHPQISTPKGPSALDLPGLTCEALSLDEVRALPAAFAHTASLAKDLGFAGVQVHAAHGFLLSQFLSPLFNMREDAYGGSIDGRMRLLLEVIDAIRAAVGPAFPVAVKLNSSDRLKGGFMPTDALAVIATLDNSTIDLIDISGGTYFPGAQSASDSIGRGPYFLDFAQQARSKTSKPLMATGGFKTFEEAEVALANGAVDMVGLARALVLDPALPNAWRATKSGGPAFPKFTDPPEGGITAWYSMRLTDIGEDRATDEPRDLATAVADYDRRDRARAELWNARFSS